MGDFGVGTTVELSKKEASKHIEDGKAAQWAWQCPVCQETMGTERPEQPTICPNPNCDYKKIRALHPNTHDKIGDLLMENYAFRTAKGDENMYIYLDGYLQNGMAESVIKQKTKEILPDCKKNLQAEAIEHVRTSSFVDRSELGLPKEKIAVENGILNLETGEMEENTPEKNVLIKLPVEYDPDAECYKIIQFIEDVFREEDVPVVQEFVGYCLWKEYPIHKAVMLLGGGENGKTTFLNLLSELIGKDNIAGRTLHDLVYDRFSKVHLFGKLANLTAETPNTKLSQVGAFKRLTGRDLVKAEKKYQQPFFFKNFAKLMFAANELPITEDMTHAFFRRWIILEFPHRFTSNPYDSHKDADPKILEKICDDSELSGFLNWAIVGLKRVLREGEFTETKSRKEIEEMWVRQTDSIRAFVDEEVEVDHDTFVTKGDFYEAYKEYCVDVETGPETKQMVGHRLPTVIPETTEFTPKVEGKRKKSWRNIRLASYPLYNRERSKFDKTKDVTEMGEDVEGGSEKVLHKESSNGPQSGEKAKFREGKKDVTDVTEMTFTQDMSKKGKNIYNGQRKFVTSVTPSEIKGDLITTIIEEIPTTEEIGYFFDPNEMEAVKALLKKWKEEGDAYIDPDGRWHLTDE